MFNLILNNFQNFAAACSGKGSFFSFPTWYKYLEGFTSTVDGTEVCTPQIKGINDFWLIGLAIVEILLRIAILAAIIFVMMGGLKYVTSRGNPEKLGQAKTSIVDALIGLAIAIIATAVVGFIGGQFRQ